MCNVAQNVDFPPATPFVFRWCRQFGAMHPPCADSLRMPSLATPWDCNQECQTSTGNCYSIGTHIHKYFLRSSIISISYSGETLCHPENCDSGYRSILETGSTGELQRSVQRRKPQTVLWCQKLQPTCWRIFADTLLLLPLSSGYWCRTERVLKVPSSMETIVGDIVVRPKLEAINQYNRWNALTEWSLRFFNVLIY